MVDPAPIRSRFALLSPHLDERGRRLFAASEARAAGHGGIAAVSRATGIAPSTIGRGLRELDEGEPLEGGWVRRDAGGRKTLVEHDPGRLGALGRPRRGMSAVRAGPVGRRARPPAGYGSWWLLISSSPTRFAPAAPAIV